MTECPKDWCGPWRHGLCVDCGKPRRLGDPPVVPLSREWCDGTPHAPDAIPPLPFHDWRFDMDNTWSICARCGASDAAAELAALVADAESKALAEHLAGTCHWSEWSCSHCERAGRMTGVAVGSIWKRKAGREIVEIRRVWVAGDETLVRAHPMRGGRPLVASAAYLREHYEREGHGDA